MIAIMAGDEADIRKARAICEGLSRLRVIDTNVQQWANAHEMAWIPIRATQITKIRPDGHCLFAAMYVSKGLSEGRPLRAADILNMGPTARQHWVDRARSILTKAADVRDPSVLDARTILLDGEQTAEEYLRLMSQKQPSRESWGGESELHVMARLWGCRICILLLREDPAEGSQVRLLTGPLGTVGHIHTLLFNGSHYDFVILTKEQLIMLGLLPCA